MWRWSRTQAWAVYALALVLLLLNDGVFKGAGLLPPWLTGKISDFAGLVVAPVTLRLLWGRRGGRSARWLFAATAVIFASINLSASASESLIAVLSMIGVSWNLWPDPSDLVALAVLPLSWAVAERVIERHPGKCRLSIKQRLCAIPAALACLASGTPNEFGASAYLYNASKETVFAEVAQVPWLDCEALSELGPEVLQWNDFESLGLFRLEAHNVLPMSSLLGDSSTQCGCSVYRVMFEGYGLVVRVPAGSVALAKRPQKDEVLDARPRLIFIEPGAEPAPGSALEVLDIPMETDGATSCLSEPGAMTFSVRLPQIVSAEIASIEPVAGNCFEVMFDVSADDSGGQFGVGGAAGNAGADGVDGSAGAATAGQAGAGGTELGSGAGGANGRVGNASLEPVYLCAPQELFPFVPGDVVSVVTRRSEEPGGSHAIEIRAGERRFKMLIGTPGHFPTEWSSYVTQAASTPCGLGRDARGAWRPLNVSFRAPASTTATPLEPDTAVAIPSASAATRVYLGRARGYLDSPACGSFSPAALNSYLEIVESWSP